MDPSKIAYSRNPACGKDLSPTASPSRLFVSSDAPKQEVGFINRSRPAPDDSPPNPSQTAPPAKRARISDTVSYGLGTSFGGAEVSSAENTAPTLPPIRTLEEGGSTMGSRRASAPEGSRYGGMENGAQTLETATTPTSNSHYPRDALQTCETSVPGRIHGGYYGFEPSPYPIYPANYHPSGYATGHGTATSGVAAPRSLSLSSVEAASGVTQEPAFGSPLPLVQGYSDPLERNDLSLAAGCVPQPPKSQQQPASSNHHGGGAWSQPEGAPQRRRGKLPQATTSILRSWLLAHTQHPYPTEEEKKMLCEQTNLTMNQVSNWFINARRRILVPPSGANTTHEIRQPARRQAQSQLARAAAQAGVAVPGLAAPPPASPAGAAFSPIASTGHGALSSAFEFRFPPPQSEPNAWSTPMRASPWPPAPVRGSAASPVPSYVSAPPSTAYHYPPHGYSAVTTGSSAGYRGHAYPPSYAGYNPATYGYSSATPK